MTLPAGKLPPDLLAALLASVPRGAPGLVVGPEPGVDAAVLDVGGRYLVLASDPVTLSVEPGIFAVQVNANDIAVMGATPQWLLASVLLPAGSTGTTVERIFSDLQRSCRELDIVLIGGHTEITSSVTQPVIAATMVGEVEPRRLVRSSGAKPGDVLILAGRLAVEGTAILAREGAAALRDRGVAEEIIAAGSALLDDPGISILPAARPLMDAVLPHAMHDPTEGGLLSAIREVVLASRTGVRLDADEVQFDPACRVICNALALDPLALLASGSLLAAVDPFDARAALDALECAGIPSWAIGEVLPPDGGMTMVRDGKEQPLLAVARDELARWLEEGSAADTGSS